MKNANESILPNRKHCSMQAWSIIIVIEFQQQATLNYKHFGVAFGAAFAAQVLKVLQTCKSCILLIDSCHGYNTIYSSWASGVINCAHGGMHTSHLSICDGWRASKSLPPNPFSAQLSRWKTNGLNALACMIFPLLLLLSGVLNAAWQCIWNQTLYDGAPK